MSAFPGAPVDDKKRNIVRAYNIGVVWEYLKGSELFFDYNQSFRLPASDEYFTWGTLDPSLKTQESQNYEVGLRHRIKDYFACSITGFWMNVENELYYNPGGGPFGWGANENYDKTRHQGLEVSAEVKPCDKVEFYANYTYTDARFRDGVYRDKFIPMVPKNKGTVGVRAFLPWDIILNIFGTYVDKRRFINDQANRWPELKRYFTLDANVFYKLNDLTVGAGINNILNEKFYEYGVCNATTGAVNFYPSAQMNFFLEARYKF